MGHEGHGRHCTRCMQGHRQDPCAIRLLSSSFALLKSGVDAVFGEILVTLAKMDWIIKHGQAALAPSRRAGNLLLAHKVTTVGWPGGLAGGPGHSSRKRSTTSPSERRSPSSHGTTRSTTSSRLFSPPSSRATRSSSSARSKSRGLPCGSLAGSERVSRLVG